MRPVSSAQRVAVWMLIPRRSATPSPATAASTQRSSSVTPPIREQIAKCDQRLAKYRERLRNAQGVVKNVYCSELVILSYQLACIKGDTIDEANRMFIRLDGKHTWPSTLRRYLKSHIGWSTLGEFKP